MSELNDLVSERNKLNLELHTLRFKESQEQRFIWWIWNVYARKVMEIFMRIKSSCTYESPLKAQSGHYSLPMVCWQDIEKVMEYSHRIYDGTYLDVEISTDVKNGIPENKPAYNENANSLLRSAWMIANRNGEQTNWEAFKSAVYKELVAEHNTNPDYYNHAKTSSDNNKLEKMKVFCPNCEKDTDCTHEAELYVCNECGEDFAKYIVSRKPSPSEVSMTQDVLINSKTSLSIENDELRKEDVK